MIVNEEGYFLKDLVSKYISVLREVGGDGYEEITFTSQYLQDKLNIVYNSKTDLDVVVRNAFENSSDASKKIQDAAFILRKEITSSNKRSLPQSLTLEDIIKGEIDSPDLLYEFLSHVTFGYDRGNRESSIKKRRVNSIAQDIIYAATGGAVKPAKQLLMGLAFKSMTGSSRIIEILNRLGHSISYNATEELETELTFSSVTGDRITPYGMSLDQSLACGVAFDNFDRYVETASGKDTLHDTVCIAYQDVAPVSIQISTPMPSGRD